MGSALSTLSSLNLSHVSHVSRRSGGRMTCGRHLNMSKQVSCTHHWISLRCISLPFPLISSKRKSVPAISSFATLSIT